ncbi:MAG TPA: Fic family protein [Blastocatellia bacterium]|nr:Fic family protein [Blastocatellia bacterium]
MQRPPGRIGPILSRLPDGGINRVNARHRALAALNVTVDERRQLETWLVNRFASATLQIEPEAPPHLTTQLTNAVREVMSLASAEGKTARLTPDLLARLNDAGLRERDGHAGRSTSQVPAAYIARAVENACDWFSAESFEELNPIEQAAIVFLRLATIRPFEQANQATALVAASLFTLRAELPPVTISPETQAALVNALAEADRMNMQPLVELIADAVTSTLDEMIGFVEKARGE